MASNEIYNNTLLLPASDDLVTGSDYQLDDLKKIEFDTKLTTHNLIYGDTNRLVTTANNFQIKLISNKTSSAVAYCQNISGLSVSREAESVQSGGEQLYTAKLPGKLKYGNVSFTHVYTNSTVFLKWLINGSNLGGAMLADIEIRVGNSAFMSYVLRDAFPVSWEIGTFSVEKYILKNGEIPVEKLTVAYGKMEYEQGYQTSPVLRPE